MRLIINNIKPMFFRAEFFFVLLLLSGHIKSYLNILELNRVDFTLAVGLLLVVVAVVDVLRANVSKGLSLNGILGLSLATLLLCSVLLSITYTSSTDYYLVKMLSFIVCMLAYFFPFSIKDFDADKAMNYFVNMSAVLALVFLLLFPFSSQIAELKSIRTSYLDVGYLCGLNVLLLSQMHTRGVLLRLFFIFSLILSGARGPMIFTFLAYLIILFGSWSEIKKYFKIKMLFIVFPLLVLSLVYMSSNENFSKMLERSVNRTVLLLNNDVDNLHMDRINQINDSINYISNKPILGYGLGSYGVVVNGEDVRAYPHNVLLEVWFEIGLFGLFSYLLFSFYHILIGFSRVNVGAGAVMFYFFINSLKSASFAELKMMYGFFAVYLVLSGSCFLRELNSKK